MTWRSWLWARRVGRAGEDGRARPRCSPLGGECEGVLARILARVGACADELYLMEVARKEVLPKWGRAGGGYLGFRREKYL